MNIRTATSTDLSDLVQMGGQLWTDASQPELEESFSITFTSPKEVTFIGEHKNTSIGFAIFH